LAQDLQECLLLQLKHKTPQVRGTCYRYYRNQFDAFTKHYDKLIQKYNISNEQLKAIHEIEDSTKTRWSFTGNNKITENVVPDFAIRIVDVN
jgi:RNA polymerase sigma-54 factor